MESLAKAVGTAATEVAKELAKEFVSKTAKELIQKVTDNTFELSFNQTVDVVNTLGGTVDHVAKVGQEIIQTLVNEINNLQKKLLTHNGVETIKDMAFVQGKIHAYNEIGNELQDKIMNKLQG